MDEKLKTFHYEADVSIDIGSHFTNRVMRAADLGVEGAFTTKKFTITYEDGVHVDPERVDKALKDMAEKPEESGFEIQNCKLITLRRVEH